MNQTRPRSVNPIPVPTPAGAEVAGHLGELVQGRMGPGGPVALVTLPCPVLVTRVEYRPAPGALRSTEPVSVKTLAAARLTLATLDRSGWGGHLSLRRASEPGAGAGSSTAETLGAVRAIARAFGSALAPETEAAICLRAEAAIDPLMHAAPVVFASREGRLLDTLPALPAMRIAGGFAGPAHPTDPDDHDFPDQSALFAALADAARRGDLERLGVAATRSAAANQARNPNPAWDRVTALAERHGALGVAVSHTGPAIALILPPDAEAPQGALADALAGAGLRRILDYRLGAASTAAAQQAPEFAPEPGSG